MITYTQQRLENGKTKPVSLKMWSITYNYPKDKLFENLKEYIPCEIILETIQLDGKIKVSYGLVSEYGLKEGVSYIHIDEIVNRKNDSYNEIYQCTRRT